MEGSLPGEVPDSDGELAPPPRDETQQIKEEAPAKGLIPGMTKRMATRDLEMARVAAMPLFQRWAYHLITWPGFETFMGLVVIANGALIGREITYKSAIPLGCDESCKCEAKTPCVAVPEWIYFVNYGLLGVYVVEVALHLFVFRLEALHNSWVIFDLLLVVLGVTEVAISEAVDTSVLKTMMIVRWLRLARLARMARVFAQFKDLWTLVQGLLNTCKPLVATFVLTAGLFYIFACLGMELIHISTDLGMDHPYNDAVSYQYRHLMDAGMLMMQVASFDSIAGVYRPLTHQNMFILLYFWAGILICSVSLMNMITAIIVEGSMANAAEDKEVAKAQAEAKKKKQMEKLKILFHELDEDGSGEVDQEEIENAPEDVLDNLKEIAGTDDIASLFEMLDYDGSGSLEVDEFCDGVLKASTCSKPMELDRMVKQCNDIVVKQRMAVAILQGHGDDLSSESLRRVSCGDLADTSGGEKTPAKRPKHPVVRDMETRCERLDARIEALKESTAQLLHGVQKLPTPLCSTRKAVVVYKGPSARGNVPDTFPEPELPFAPLNRPQSAARSVPARQRARAIGQSSSRA